jgi:hypothetical protein
MSPLVARHSGLNPSAEIGHGKKREAATEVKITKCAALFGTTDCRLG